jgi:dTDP-glucose pyrophosphorylase
MGDESINTAWKKIILPTYATIQDALYVLDESGLRIVLVIDAHGKLIGTISDGDLRRGFINGSSLTDSIESLTHREYLGASPEMSRTQVLELMLENGIQQIPIIDKEQNLIGLHLWDEIRKPTRLSNKLFILAGGKGTRLAPLTNNCPKPMLPVAGKPILEHIVERARGEGISNLVFSINYLGSVIEEYFGDGTNFGVDITYVKENLPLGTAGALSLLKEKIDQPILVSNGDLITDIRYSEMLAFHVAHQSFITVATRSHEWQNPYGVVLTSGSQVVGYEEKPLSKSNINAGVYILDPMALSLLQFNEHCDMPSLLTKALGFGNRLYAYPMHENWLDVGRPADLELANDRLERKGEFI